MSRSTVRIFASWVLLVVCTTNSFGQEARQLPTLEEFPKVVAVINGSTISRDKLAQECMRRFGSVVLDNILNKQLILQACQAKGITITQADVNEEIRATATKFGITTKLFLENLEKERDITPEQYASEIVWPMMALRALAADRIEVTPQEIQEIIQSEYGEKVQVRLIAVANPQKAQQLHAQAKAAPETFGRLATTHSEEAVSASVDGLLPPIRRYSGDDQFERIAFQLQPNEISPIFQVGDQYNFLQCVRRMPPSMPNAQVLPLIEERISEQLRDRRLGQAANDIFAELQKTSELYTVLGDQEREQKYPGVAAYLNRQPIPLTFLAYECVARHGKQILRGEIDRYLLMQELKNSNKVVIQPDIDAEIARVADAAGYIDSQGKPDSQAWLQAIMEEEGATIDLYVDDSVWPTVALKKLVEDDIEITEEDIQKSFESNFGPRAEVLAIVLSNQRTAQDVFRQARENLTEQAFGELAAKYSVDAVSRSNFGKIPALRRHGGRPTLEKEAFALEPGQISGVIAWGEQYAILYKQRETTPIVQDLEAVRPELAKEIREKKLQINMHRKLDEIHRAAQIENLLDNTSQEGNVAAAPASPAANAPASRR
ncbi:MAG: peptidylprolyl isomerase [Planctomycetales bacterium]|nr:peptidylprolyl isomerase [Planctomycetales bacterium]